MSPFVPKGWKNKPDESTPINAAALVDLEERLAVYAESLGGGGTESVAFLPGQFIGTIKTPYKNIEAITSLGGAIFGAEVVSPLIKAGTTVSKVTEVKTGEWTLELSVPQSQLSAEHKTVPFTVRKVSTKRSTIELLGGVTQDNSALSSTRISVQKEFVDINSFFNVKGEAKGITASEAREGVDAAPIISEAIEKAETVNGSKAFSSTASTFSSTTGTFTITSPKGMVACSEPAEYLLESTRVTRNPKPAALFKAAVKYGVIVTPGVTLEGFNNKSMTLVAGPALIAAREATTEPTVLVGVEAGATLPVHNLTLTMNTNVGSEYESKFPPEHPDAFLMGSSGKVEGLRIGEGFKYGAIVASNHNKWVNCSFGGWARTARVNYANETGNIEYYGCNFQDGFTGIYCENESGIEGEWMFGCYLGHSKGPIIYKRECAGKGKGFIFGLKMIQTQFEGGNRGGAYCEDGEGAITFFDVVNLEMGGADPPLSKIGNGDISQFPDAFIKCRSMTNCTMIGSSFVPRAGWGVDQLNPAKPAAGVIATEKCENNNFGDISEAIVACRDRGVPFISSPKQTENIAECRDEETGDYHKVVFPIANSEVRDKEVVRRAAPTSTTEGALAAQGFDKVDGIGVGVAMQSAATGRSFPMAVKDPTQPAVINTRVAIGLGKGNATGGQFPPLARSGKTKLTAALEFGSGTGEEHEAPVMIFNYKPSETSSVYLSGLSDFPETNGTVSIAGHIVRYRQTIAKGAVQSFKGKTSGKLPKVTNIPIGEMTKLGVGVRVAGTGVAAHSYITSIDKVGDGVHGTLILSRNATASGENTLTGTSPVAMLEGALMDTSTRTTAEVKTSTLKGESGQNVPVISTEGFPAAGNFELEGASIEYTSKTSTEFIKCKASGSKNVEPQTIVLTPGVKSIGAKAKVYRVAQVENLEAGAATYEGLEEKLSTTEKTLSVKISGSFPASGIGAIFVRSTLPIAYTFNETVTEFKVTSIAGFPKIGKLEIGSKLICEYTNINTGTNTFLGCTFKFIKKHEDQPAGQYVQLTDSIEFGYGEVNVAKTELKKVKLEATGNYLTAKGARIEIYNFSPKGGVFSQGATMLAYQGVTEAAGKNYIVGIPTPVGGGGLLSGTEIEDLPVMGATGGSGYPSGPASLSAAATGGTTMSYERFLSVTSESAEEEEEVVEEEGGEEQTGEVGTSIVAGGFFVGISNIEGTVGKGKLLAGALLGANIKPSTLPGSITASSATLLEKFPSKGALKVGKWTATYNKITGAKFEEVTWTSGTVTTEYATGAPITLVNGSQVKADSTVRTAYSTTHKTIGDKGVATESAGTEGAEIGLAIAADIGGLIESMI